MILRVIRPNLKKKKKKMKSKASDSSLFILHSSLFTLHLHPPSFGGGLRGASYNGLFPSSPPEVPPPAEPSSGTGVVSSADSDSSIHSTSSVSTRARV